MRFAVGGVVHFPINVLLDVFDGGEGAGFSELRRSLGLGAGGFVDLGDEFFVEHAFFEEGGLENHDGILGAFVVFDFFFLAVSGVGVGDGVAAVAVGADFENAGFALFVGELEGVGDGFADGEHVVTVFDDGPVHAVTFCALGEARAGGGAGLARAHGVAVVFDDEDAGQIPEGGEIVGFVHGALVDGSVTHEREAGAFAAVVFQREREAGAEWDLAADDAVATPEITRRVKVVHGAALAFGAAGVFAVVFGHHLVHAHADGETVAVVAIGSDDVVVFAHDGDAADGDGLLADVKVEEAANFALLITAEAALFEAADAHHVAVELDEFVRAELGVDVGVAGRATGLASFGFLGGGGFLAHDIILNLK